MNETIVNIDEAFKSISNRSRIEIERRYDKILYESNDNPKFPNRLMGIVVSNLNTLLDVDTCKDMINKLISTSNKNNSVVYDIDECQISITVLKVVDGNLSRDFIAELKYRPLIVIIQKADQEGADNFVLYISKPKK